jgi:hypothetical protein
MIVLFQHSCKDSTLPTSPEEKGISGQDKVSLRIVIDSVFADTAFVAGETVQIKGVVMDTLGNKVSGITVKADGKDEEGGGKTWESETNSEGRFTLDYIETVAGLGKEVEVTSDEAVSASVSINVVPAVPSAESSSVEYMGLNDDTDELIVDQEDLKIEFTVKDRYDNKRVAEGDKVVYKLSKSDDNATGKQINISRDSQLVKTGILDMNDDGIHVAELNFIEDTRDDTNEVLGKGTYVIRFSIESSDLNETIDFPDEKDFTVKDEDGIANRLELNWDIPEEMFAGDKIEPAPNVKLYDTNGGVIEGYLADVINNKFGRIRVRLFEKNDQDEYKEIDEWPFDGNITGADGSMRELDTSEKIESDNTLFNELYIDIAGEYKFRFELYYNTINDIIEIIKDPDNQPIVTESNTFIITPTVPEALDLASNPADATVGQPIKDEGGNPIQLTVKDRFGNTVDNLTLNIRARLFVIDTNDSDDDGSTEDFVSATDQNILSGDIQETSEGTAIFNNLRISEAGTYKIQFQLFDERGNPIPNNDDQIVEWSEKFEISSVGE